MESSMSKAVAKQMSPVHTSTKRRLLTGTARAAEGIRVGCETHKSYGDRDEGDQTSVEHSSAQASSNEGRAVLDVRRSSTDTRDDTHPTGRLRAVSA